MDQIVAATYGDRVRTRVCGLCWQGDEILLVKHSGLNNAGFWAPPGGGLEFGETVQEALIREFLEETGLAIEVGRFLFACEVIKTPLHAIELFFQTSIKGGILKKGSDPEIDIIEEVRFAGMEFLKSLSAEQLHGIFTIASTREDFEQLNGFYRI